MGTPGVPWQPPKPIEPILKKHRGVLSHACKELDCEHKCLATYIKARPELKELLDELRRGRTECSLDVAESVLDKKMKDDTSTDQLKAAIYVLNNLGKSRGYAHPIAEQLKMISPEDMQKMSEFLKSIPQVKE